MTEIVIDYKPRNQFVPFHERHQRWAAIVAHRRCGKTVACVHDLQRGAVLCERPNPRFAYIAPLLKQAKDVSWSYLKAAASPLIPYGASINESDLRADYPNGGRVRLYGADNPDALRGIYLDGVVFDEYADMDPRMWSEIIRPALADRGGWAVFIGTPKGRDAFYSIWREALTKPAEWFSASLSASQTGILPQSELDAARAAMSEAQYNREFECSFDEPSEDQFMPTSVVNESQAREPRPTGPKLIGVDVARFGDDRTVVLYRNGASLLKDDIKTWRGLDLMQTAARVAEIITARKPDAVFVDDVGVGGGVTDRLRQLGFQVIGVNAGSRAFNPDRFINRRAEMWFKMRDWVRDTGSLPHDDLLVSDLTAPSYSYDHSNRIRLESKEDMKKRGLPSPDMGDALALTFAEPVATGDVLKVRWATAEPEVDPLDNW